MSHPWMPRRSPVAPEHGSGHIEYCVSRILLVGISTDVGIISMRHLYMSYPI